MLNCDRQLIGNIMRNGSIFVTEWISSAATKVERTDQFSLIHQWNTQPGMDATLHGQPLIQLGGLWVRQHVVCKPGFVLQKLVNNALSELLYSDRGFCNLFFSIEIC